MDAAAQVEHLFAVNHARRIGSDRIAAQVAVARGRQAHLFRRRSEHLASRGKRQRHGRRIGEPQVVAARQRRVQGRVAGQMSARIISLHFEHGHFGLARAKPMSNCASHTTSSPHTAAMAGTASQAHSTRPKRRNTSQLIGTITSRYRPTIFKTNWRRGTEMPAASRSVSRAALEIQLWSFQPANPAWPLSRSINSVCIVY